MTTRLLQLVLLLLLTASPAFATEPSPPTLQFHQHLGRRLPLDLSFRDQEGRAVALRAYFTAPDRPVLLVPGYVRCEMLCSALSDGLLRALQGLRESAGREFQVVYVSIDPEERDEAAARKRRVWSQRYGRLGSENGVTYLRGDPQVVAALMKEVGFEYEYDSVRHEYAHPAGFLVVSGEGIITHTMLGVVFSARELEAAIQQSSRGTQGSLLDRFLLICSHYNPIRSRHGGWVMTSLRLIGTGVIVGLILAVRVRRRGE